MTRTFPSSVPRGRGLSWGRAREHRNQASDFLSSLESGLSLARMGCRLGERWGAVTLRMRLDPCGSHTCFLISLNCRKVLLKSRVLASIMPRARSRRLFTTGVGRAERGHLSGAPRPCTAVWQPSRGSLEDRGLDPRSPRQPIGAPQKQAGHSEGFVPGNEPRGHLHRQYWDLHREKPQTGRFPHPTLQMKREASFQKLMRLPLQHSTTARLAPCLFNSV